LLLRLAFVMVFLSVYIQLRYKVLHILDILKLTIYFNKLLYYFRLNHKMKDTLGF
jgi:hypothetical protein